MYGFEQRGFPIESNHIQVFFSHKVKTCSKVCFFNNPWYIFFGGDLKFLSWNLDPYINHQNDMTWKLWRKKIPHFFSISTPHHICCEELKIMGKNLGPYIHDINDMQLKIWPISFHIFFQKNMRIDVVFCSTEEDAKLIYLRVDATKKFRTFTTFS